MNIKNILTFLAIFLVLTVAIYVTSPVTDDLGKYSVNLVGLLPSQRSNICLASRKINKIILKPGQEFSFNKVVGPRTLTRGFVTSPVIFEGETVNAIGGGICLLSSALYNAVLNANLKVTERIAHTMPVRSVPIGLDATVWYGKNDLKFVNNTNNKIVINSICYLDRLNVLIQGEGSLNPAKITVEKSKLSDRKIDVRVYKSVDGVNKKISEDIYLYNASSKHLPVIKKGDDD